MVVDEAMSHVWAWFWDLSSSRPYDQSGPLPLSNLEMWAWSQLTGQIVTSDEWSMLRSMDAAYRAAFSKEQADAAARAKARAGAEGKP